MSQNARNMSKKFQISIFFFWANRYVPPDSSKGPLLCDMPYLLGKLCKHNSVQPPTLLRSYIPYIFL